MKNHADAQDMTQETFCQMLRKPFRYESDEKTKAWLIVCASNLCKNHLKKWWIKRTVALDESIGDYGEALSLQTYSERAPVHAGVRDIQPRLLRRYCSIYLPDDRWTADNTA